MPRHASPTGDPRPRNDAARSRLRRTFTPWRSRPDAEIALSLRAALAERPDAAAIEFLVADGVVNITGELAELKDTEAVRRIAIGVIGVRRVNDWMTSTGEVPFLEI